MTISSHTLAVYEETLRNHEMKIVLRACHRDVEQATLLFQLLSSAGAKIGGDAAINDVEDKDRFPLLAFCRMNRRQDQVVLIKQRYTGLVAGGIRWVERELG